MDLIILQHNSSHLNVFLRLGQYRFNFVFSCKVTMSEETNRFGDEKKKILPITTFQVLDRLNTLQ